METSEGIVGERVLYTEGLLLQEMGHGASVHQHYIVNPLFQLSPQYLLVLAFVGVAVLMKKQPAGCNPLLPGVPSVQDLVVQVAHAAECGYMKLVADSAVHSNPSVVASAAD